MLLNRLPRIESWYVWIVKLRSLPFSCSSRSESSGVQRWERGGWGSWHPPGYKKSPSIINIFERQLRGWSGAHPSQWVGPEHLFTSVSWPRAPTILWATHTLCTCSDARSSWNSPVSWLIHSIAHAHIRARAHALAHQYTPTATETHLAQRHTLGGWWGEAVCDGLPQTVGLSSQQKLFCASETAILVAQSIFVSRSPFLLLPLLLSLCFTVNMLSFKTRSFFYFCNLLLLNLPSTKIVLNLFWLVLAWFMFLLR